MAPRKHTGTWHQTEALGRKFFEKSLLSWLHFLLFFQYDSILVRNQRFGCSSGTEPVVDGNLGRRALLLSAAPLSSLPKPVCSGSGRNTEPNTYVSDMRLRVSTASHLQGPGAASWSPAGKSISHPLPLTSCEFSLFRLSSLGGVWGGYDQGSHICKVRVKKSYFTNYSLCVAVGYLLRIKPTGEIL